MRFDKKVIRASALGRIMSGIPKPLTENQSQTFEAYLERNSGDGKPLTTNQLETLGDLLKKKNAKCQLSDGAKTYLEELVWEDLTGRSKNISAKYLDKGIMCEQESFDLYCDVTQTMFEKNKERRTNGFFTGEPDNVQDGIIRDIKSSWEYNTFPLREKEITNKMYEWQLDAYMDLWGFESAQLIYCLVDTPFNLIEDEIRRLDWKTNILDTSGVVRENCIDLVVETVSNHLYSFDSLEKFCQQSTILDIDWFAGSFKEIPKEVRVKVFDYERDEKRILQAQEMVLLAREYMNEIVLGIGDNIEKLTNNK